MAPMLKKRGEFNAFFLKCDGIGLNDRDFILLCAMEAGFSTYQLPNGIRFIHRQNQSEVAHFGLLVHTGTRDEESDEHGLAHFMEHMFFKGTKKRSPYQIISRLEDVGGEINAYTTKEETALYASFLKQDSRRAIELIQDIFLHSSFPEKEREKEAEVILNEIRIYEDTPSELIFDRADEVLFPDHPIGRNILGTESSLQGFMNGSLHRFRQQNYASEELVLSYVGALPFKQVKNYVDRYYFDLPSSSRTRERIEPETAHGKELREKRDTSQLHAMLIGRAYSLKDARRLKLYLLNNILGGPGMNSRLNMALRERKGYTYSAESHYAPFTDSGSLTIYFSTDPELFDKSLEVVWKEMSRLKKDLLTEKRLKHARKQLMGQLAIASENNEHIMLTAAKSSLVFNQIQNLEQICKQLEEISAEELRKTANEVFDSSRLNTIVFE